MRNAILYSLLIFGCPVISHAQDCNPLNYRDNTVVFKDQQTRLAYAEDMTHNRSGTSASSGGIDFFDILALDGNSQSNYVDNLTKLVKVNFKQTDLLFLYTSEMSDNELKAYQSRCGQQNIFLTPSQGSASSQSFSVQISLHKSLGNAEIPITIDLTGAKITGVSPGNWKISNNDGQAKGVILEGGQASVRVTRNPNEPFEITVSAPAENQTISLPAPPTMHLVEESRYSTVQRSQCDQGCFHESLQSGALTFNAITDEVIKPRSEYIEVFSKGSSPGFSPDRSGFYYQNLDVKSYSAKYNARDFYVPLSVTTAAPPHGTSWCAAWMEHVKVFVAVPIGQPSSGREPLSKPDVVCTYRP